MKLRTLVRRIQRIGRVRTNVPSWSLVEMGGYLGTSRDLCDIRRYRLNEVGVADEIVRGDIGNRLHDASTQSGRNYESII